MSFQIGDKVKWTEAKDGGWAGDGKGEIVAYDEQRPHFTGGRPLVVQTKEGKINIEAGPAVCIKLANRFQHTVWCSPDEIMPDLDAVPA